MRISDWSSDVCSSDLFALISEGAIVARWRIATDPRRTADEFAVWLNQLLQLEGYQRSDVHGVIIATVVPKALHNLTVLAQKYFGGDPLVAGEPPVEWGIARSEEHTSELQSLMRSSSAVLRLKQTN